MDILELESKTISELRKIAEDLNFPKPIRLKREGLGLGHTAPLLTRRNKVLNNAKKKHTDDLVH